MKNILIVEDSFTFRQQLEIYLKELDVNIIFAECEKSFLDIIEKQDNIDLIFMDLFLSEDNGLNLIEHLKESNDYKDKPIIIITEFSKEDYVLKAKDLGVKEFLRKPVSKDVLIEKVNRLIF